MTLKEKFKKATSQWFDTTECEQIANDCVIDFIDNLDNEIINKIRNSKSDAEARRLLKNKLNN